MKQMSRIAVRTTVLPAFAQLRRPCRNHPEPNETNLKTSSLCRTAIRFRNFRTPEPAHPRPRKTTITTAGTERATERSLVPAQIKPLTRNFYEFQKTGNNPSGTFGRTHALLLRQRHGRWSRSRRRTHGQPPDHRGGGNGRNIRHRDQDQSPLGGTGEQGFHQSEPFVGHRQRHDGHHRRKEPHAGGTQRRRRGMD